MEEHPPMPFIPFIIFHMPAYSEKERETFQRQKDIENIRKRKKEKGREKEEREREREEKDAFLRLDGSNVDLIIRHFESSQFGDIMGF